MQLDKKFLATLLGVDEPEIATMSGMTFELSNTSEGIVTFKSLIHDRQKKRIEALAKVLRADDDLGKVVRAHIYIEHELQDYIFFAAPNRDQLRSFERMEYSEKVQLALVLGLKDELKPALNAAGKLRNKFSHRLETKLGGDEAKNLIATLSPKAKQGVHSLVQDIMSELPSTLLEDGALAYFKAQIQVLAFFLRLFDEVAEERHRIAFEKLQSITAGPNANPDRHQNDTIC